MEQIRHKISTDQAKQLNELIHLDSDTVYNSLYVGRVVDNNDPLRLGRCKIMVHGLFNSIQTADLPWALPEFTFIGSINGGFVVPEVDTMVHVIFADGDIYRPIYRGKGLKENQLPLNKDTNYPNNMILWSTVDGDYFSVNKTTKEITLHHQSGTTILINRDGGIEVSSQGDVEISCSNANITCEKLTINDGVDGASLEVI